METLLKVTGGATLFALNTVLAGFTVSCLWNWFLVPFGIIEISIAWAIGLICAKKSLLGTKSPSKDKHFSQLAIESILSYLIILWLGYIAKQFM